MRYPIGKHDVTGRPILLGDTLEATFASPEPYTATLKVVICPKTLEPSLQMLTGNPKAMERFWQHHPYMAFPYECNKGWLKKGKIINR